MPKRKVVSKSKATTPGDELSAPDISTVTAEKVAKSQKTLEKKVTEETEKSLVGSTSSGSRKRKVEVVSEAGGEAEGATKPAKSKQPRKKKDNGELTLPTGKKAEMLNKSSSEYLSVDFTCSKKAANGCDWNLKIACWNIGGLRAWQKKGGMEYIEHEKPDILCIQEVKISEDKLESSLRNILGYTSYWSLGETDGYAGVGIYSKTEPLSVKNGIDDADHDKEGRVITAEYEKFYLVNAYVPNAGRGLKTLGERMKWDPVFRNYLKSLDEKKPVILCGDLNVAHTEIDLANPKTNKKNAGFTQEERDGFSTLLNTGFVDTFRNLYPDRTGAYTFWTYMRNARSKNIGWRLDYFLISERLLPSVCDAVIRSEVFGSDHCPLVLFLNM